MKKYSKYKNIYMKNIENIYIPICFAVLQSAF